MGFQENLLELFKRHTSGPFLFIGSGFSRRYLGVEDWAGLLRRFCIGENPYEYYFAMSKGILPTLASLLADDFSKDWWKQHKDKDKAIGLDRYMINNSSPLKFAISDYLCEISEDFMSSAEHANELALLSDLNVDGIITTNWDTVIEELFTDYKVFIGQKELLFSNPQGIGEIYKIHGCITKPNTLVLTDEDYDNFNKLNPYLAAKLITIFIEHPVVFIGYSTSDQNILKLLISISKCLDKTQISKFKNNLIFVKRLHDGDEEGITDSIMLTDGISIPYVQVKTNQFDLIYRTINETKRKIPSRILRLCKEQLYELVATSEPSKKLCLVGLDEIESKDDIDFVVGIGAIEKIKEVPSEIGYKSYKYEDIIKDYFSPQPTLDTEQILRVTIPDLRKAGRRYVPIFKYLRDLGVNSKCEYIKRKFCFNDLVDKTYDDLKVAQYAKSINKLKEINLKKMIETEPANTVASKIPCVQPELIDKELLRQFILDNIDKLHCNVTSYCSVYRKLIFFYDKLVYGWDD